jgi:hypothetical protein
MFIREDARKHSKRRWWVSPLKSSWILGRMRCFALNGQFDIIIGESKVLSLRRSERFSPLVTRGSVKNTFLATTKAL